MLKGLGVASPEPSREEELDMLPQVRGGGPSSEGDGEGAESMKA